MDALIWGAMFVVAIFDAREHRIPNVMLILILALCFISKFLQPEPLLALGWSLLAFICSFAGALLLYFMRIMAPGDVKLISVVGFWLGWGHLLAAYFWIAMASVVVGVFYAILTVAGNHSQGRMIFTKYTILATYGAKAANEIKPTKGEKLHMPFAPVVVIGLAMYQYF